MEKRGAIPGTDPRDTRPFPPGRRRALDPFFVFTYTLLALAVAIQIFLMLWMDIL